MLYASELTWNGQDKVEGPYQLAINRICSGPVADPGHPRMARAIHGWPGVRDWPGKTGPSADGLATITNPKTI